MSNGSGLFRRQAAQKPHLLRGSGGVAAEVGDLRSDVLEEMSPVSAFTVDEFTNPATADTDGIKTSIATVASPQTYTGAALNGAVGAGVMDPPRNLTITTGGGTPADAPVSTTITGLDVNGDVIIETILLSQIAGTAVGIKAFRKVTQIVLPAADGVGALLEFGFGTKIGLSKKIRVRAGLSTLLMEIEVGVKVTTGTIAPAAVGLPNGTYLPATLPDGIRDYAVYYEYDPQA